MDRFDSRRTRQKWPIEVGTTYQNRNRQGQWTEYELIALEQDALFILRQEDGAYRVRYDLKPLRANRTELTYTELVDTGEIEAPFTQAVLHKLKAVLEAQH